MAQSLSRGFVRFADDGRCTVNEDGGSIDDGSCSSSRLRGIAVRNSLNGRSAGCVCTENSCSKQRGSMEACDGRQSGSAVCDSLYSRSASCVCTRSNCSGRHTDAEFNRIGSGCSINTSGSSGATGGGSYSRRCCVDAIGSRNNGGRSSTDVRAHSVSGMLDCRGGTLGSSSIDHGTYSVSSHMDTRSGKVGRSSSSTNYGTYSASSMHATIACRSGRLGSSSSSTSSTSDAVKHGISSVLDCRSGRRGRSSCGGPGVKALEHGIARLSVACEDDVPTAYQSLLPPPVNGNIGDHRSQGATQSINKSLKFAIYSNDV